MGPAYQGQLHWQTQKDIMLQNLIAQGKSPEEAQAIVARITALQAGAGNIPAKHPDSGTAVSALPTTPHPPGVSSPVPAQGPATPAMAATAPQAPSVSPPAPPSAAPPTTPAAPQPSPTMGPMGAEPSIFDNPDAVKSVLGMGGLNRRLSQAESMRDADFARGRTVANGRLYVGATPLEHIAVTASKLKGRKDAKRIGKKLDASKEELINLLRQPHEMSKIASSTEMNLPEYGRRMA